MAYDGESLKVVGPSPIRPDGVDKFIGRANFGADMVMPGMLWGKIKRSPHAHARIRSIKTDKAAALPGVKAVVTSADFPEIPSEEAFVGEGPMNFRDLSYNCMARGKVLYDGHAVAAVAAMSSAIAEEAAELIEVDYEVLPHVIDVEEAMKPNAPILHDDLFTQGVEPKPTAPSNVAKRITFTKGDFATGWKEAEVTIERRYTSKAVHQGYIEPHACVVAIGNDGQCTIWSSSQGQFMVRAYCAKLLNIDLANIRAMPAEIGGGFGGKTLVYLEPVALALSKKSGRPVKIVMSREEVFRGTGPAAGGVYEVKLGAKKDGRLVAAELVVKLQAGAFPGSPVGPACMCGLATDASPHVSMAMMAGEALGIPYDKVRPVVGDTASVGFSFLTGGSRVTFATGMAVTQAAEKVVVELKKRAAAIWDISPEAVEWKDGKAYPAGPNAGSFEPLSLQEIALKAGRTGGPVSAEGSSHAQGAGAGWARRTCDVE